MNQHFNQLSPAEDERLACLIEELAEVNLELMEMIENPCSGKTEQWDALATEMGQVLFFSALIRENDLQQTEAIINENEYHQSIIKDLFLDKHCSKLVKETSYTTQICGKILRHGYDSQCPVELKSNRQFLRECLDRIEVRITLILSANSYNDYANSAAQAKANKIHQYWHHN